MPKSANMIEKRRKAIVCPPELDDSVVKSAARVLQILEFFDDIKRPATVSEVSERLGFPQSSTSALLHSLTKLGYLNHDRHSRTYTTSIRTALLGNWVDTKFVKGGDVIQMMEELGKKTGNIILLAVRNGLYSHYVHVIQAVNPIHLHITLGTVRPLVASGAGYALLSRMSDKEITQSVLAHNFHVCRGEKRKTEQMVDLEHVLERVDEVRKNGYAFTSDLVTPGGGVLAAPLPVNFDQQEMAVGIGGNSQVMKARREELILMLKSAIADHFGGQRA